MRTGDRGFGLLLLLAALAVLGIGLSTAGVVLRQAAERERERELQFRGLQYRQAIERYWRAVQPHELPASLDDLLVDRRAGGPRHHLRRLYADPFSGRADWELVADADSGRVAGVASRVARARIDESASTRFVFTPPAPAAASAP